jgi:hypothetical protein
MLRFFFRLEFIVNLLAFAYFFLIQAFKAHALHTAIPRGVSFADK